MSYLNVSCDGKVATVLIDRHQKGNSLNPDLLKEIYSTFNKLSTDNKINVIILTGGEKYFSAGFDLNEIKKIKIEKNNEYIELFHQAYKSILFCSLPVIAAIGGPAIAGGFDLSMMCDFRYASTKAKFGQREIPLSLTPILDPLWRIIGYSRALEVSFTGRIYDVQEAYAKDNISISNQTDANETILANTSFPVGLIVNEFVTNSYKYAFDDDETGVIDIAIKSENEAYYLLLKDNGKGLPKDFDIDNLDSFGMETIQE